MPFASSTEPALKSRPAKRICRPFEEAVCTTTVSPSRVVFSWITMVSAPGGITPPVKIRAASPGPTVPSNGCPARDDADELQLRRCVRRSHVDRTDRIAVHRRNIRRWLGPPRGKVGGEHAAVGVAERRRLGGQGRHAVEDQPQRFRNRHQRRRHNLTPSPGSGRTCRRSSRSGARPRCACRARPPSPCRRW